MATAQDVQPGCESIGQPIYLSLKMTDHQTINQKKDAMHKPGENVTTNTHPQRMANNAQRYSVVSLVISNILTLIVAVAIASVITYLITRTSESLSNLYVVLRSLRLSQH